MSDGGSDWSCEEDTHHQVPAASATDMARMRSTLAAVTHELAAAKLALDAMTAKAQELEAQLAEERAARSPAVSSEEAGGQGAPACLAGGTLELRW
eukprot:1113912-Prymnesium_polylepis.1